MSPPDPAVTAAAAPFDRIVVPVGPGAFAERALPLAFDLAARAGVPVELLSVAPPHEEADRAARLAGLAGRAPARVPVTTHTARYGSIAKTVAAAAAPDALVCMSSHGSPVTGRNLLGGVTEQVLGSARGPVAVIGPGVATGTGLGAGCVAVCLDGSVASERGLEPARRWSRAFGLALWLVRVAAPGAPAAVESALEGLAGTTAGVAGWRVVHDRHPVAALAVLAETLPAAVLVMATHGRTGWSRARVGSVTAAAIHRVAVPVLAVPNRR